MRSAQSRLGLLSSLEAVGKGVAGCARALPVPRVAFKTAGAVVGGVAGVLLLRALMPRRRSVSRVAAPVPAVAAPKRESGLAGQLISQTFIVLLLPLLRYYLVDARAPQPGRSAAASPSFLLDKLVSRLLRLGR